MNVSLPRSPEPRTLVDSDSRIALGIFLLVAVTFGYFFGGGGWNQNSHFDLTRAIVEQRTFAIDDFKENTLDVSFHDGHVYANKSPGISMLAAIPYAAAYGVETVAGIDPGSPMMMTVNAWICTFAICGLLGALIPAVLFRYGRSVLGVSRRRALAVSLVIALGTPILAYASVLFLHVPSAAMLLLSFTIISRSRGASASLAGLFAGLAGLCNYLCIPAAVVLLAMNLSFEGPRLRRALAFVGAAAPSAGLLLIYQQIAFGSALQTPIDTMSRAFVDDEAFWGIIRIPSVEAAWGITFSRFRGLFYLSPLLLLAIGGAVVMWRAARRPEVATIIATVMWFFAFTVTFNGWHGGSAIGPRYMLPVVPLLGVLMMQIRGVPRFVWVAGASVSFALNFAATAVDPLPANTIRDPIGSYVLPLLVSGQLPDGVPELENWPGREQLGHVSVNRQSIDSFVPYVKYPIGSPEAEWASFNVGEVLAPGSPISLLPILAWIAACVIVLWRVARIPA